jgi:hypothetical protein
MAEWQEYEAMSLIALENEPSSAALETLNQRLIGLAQQDQFKKGFTTENHTVTAKD